MDAPGSYVSPVVRDFLSFYAKCLNAKLSDSFESVLFADEWLTSFLWFELTRSQDLPRTVLVIADPAGTRSEHALERSPARATGRVRSRVSGVREGRVVLFHGGVDRLRLKTA